MQSMWLGKGKALVLFFLLAIAAPVVATADPISLIWDANTTAVTGYKVYVSTTAGGSLTASNPTDVGNVTSWTFPNAVAGTRYYFSVTAYVTDSNGTVEGPHSAEVSGWSNAPPSITNPGNRTSTVGTAISALQLVGSDPYGEPVSFTASGLPAGLTLAPTTGLIPGTPTTANTYNVTVGVTDGVLSASASFTWTVNAAPVPDTTVPTISITSPTNQSTYATSSSSVTLSGTANDNVGVT